jgi:hypothetical protein
MHIDNALLKQLFHFIGRIFFKSRTRRLQCRVPGTDTQVCSSKIPQDDGIIRVEGISPFDALQSLGRPVQVLNKNPSYYVVVCRHFPQCVGLTESCDGFLKSSHVDQRMPCPMRRRIIVGLQCRSGSKGLEGGIEVSVIQRFPSCLHQSLEFSGKKLLDISSNRLAGYRTRLAAAGKSRLLRSVLAGWKQE